MAEKVKTLELNVSVTYFVHCAAQISTWSLVTENVFNVFGISVNRLADRLKKEGKEIVYNSLVVKALKPPYKYRPTKDAMVISLISKECKKISRCCRSEENHEAIHFL